MESRSKADQARYRREIYEFTYIRGPSREHSALLARRPVDAFLGIRRNAHHANVAFRIFGSRARRVIGTGIVAARRPTTRGVSFPSKRDRLPRRRKVSGKQRVRSLYSGLSLPESRLDQFCDKGKDTYLTVLKYRPSSRIH